MFLSGCRQFLRELRDYQVSIKLFDESAEEIVREATRQQVEQWLAAAVEVARSPGKAKDPAAVVEVSCTQHMCYNMCYVLCCNKTM